MMLNSIFLAAQESLSWADRGTITVTVTLQGILTVFLVLASLWAIIEIMHTKRWKRFRLVSRRRALWHIRCPRTTVRW